MSAAATTPDEPSVRARVEEILGDRSPAEVALACRMVDGFPAKAARLLGDFDSACDISDVDAAARALHTLKGTALNLGLDALAQTCQSWEDLVRSGAGPSDTERLRSDVLDLVAGGTLVLQQVAVDLPRDAGPQVTRLA